MSEFHGTYVLKIFLICVITIVSLIQFDYKNKRYQTLLSVLAMFVLLLGGMANMIISIIFQDTYGNTIGSSRPYQVLH